MVVKDEHGRILITHEAASENGEDARRFLQRGKDLGLQGTAAFSDDSQSFTEAIKAVFPHARFQADHFHTVKNIPTVCSSMIPLAYCYINRFQRASSVARP